MNTQIVYFDIKILVRSIYDDVDLAIINAWTPRHWERIGFALYVRSRIGTVRQLRMVLARLGAVTAIRQLNGYKDDEQVSFNLE